jgi:NADPH2:quinone reductase
MKAWVVRRNGAPESMAFEDLPDAPTPPGMVRIAVAAAGVNFFDSLLVAGTYQEKPELPFIPGAELAGIVTDAAPGSGFGTGDRVLARVRAGGLGGGGYAEVAFARPQETLAIPDSMPFEDAAAFFINYQTGWFGLHRRARLQAGEFLLVHAASGGVGSAAVQLGKAAGATVIASVGSPPKAEVARRLGADLVVEHRREDLAQAVKEFTKGHGADVVYDPVGGEAFERATKCIAFEGRLVVVGFTSGQIPQARANHLLVKNYSVVGLHWGLYAQRRPELIDRCTDELLRLHAEGRISPYVSRRLPLERGAEALGDVAAGRTTGKTVLVTARNSNP